MNRRSFLGNASILAVATPLIATKAVVDFAREKRAPIKMQQTGNILTAEYINEIVSRINDLENRI